MNVAGLILAGGASRRMGSPKALLDFGGESFLDRLIRIFSEGCSSVTVVLGHDWERLRPSRAKWVVNPAPERGMLSSLQTGLETLPAEADAVLFTPVDYPGIQVSTVRALIHSFSREALFVRPRFRGRNGHPILFASSLIAEFLALSPNESARGVVHRHAAETLYVDVEDPGILRDIDEPQDYEELLATLSAR